MATFQFYKKQNALVHINIDTSSFMLETEQLLEQGFEIVGDIVKAETSYVAFNKFKSTQIDQQNQFSNSHLFVNAHWLEELFMSWYLIGLIVFIGLALQYYYVYYSPQQHSDWHKLPFLAEYLVLHPECKTDDDENARCYHCESDKVLFQPLTCHSDPRYKHICLNCKTTLFKSKSII